MRINELLANADKVEDWSAFWNDKSLYFDKYGIGVEEDEEGKARAQAMGPAELSSMIFEAMPELRRRSDFIGREPFGLQDADHSATLPVVADEPEVPEQMNEWDLRAKMEKQRQKELQRLDWERRKSRIGMWEPLSMEGDIRMVPLPYETPEDMDMDWPEEKIWDLITMGGKAVDPRLPGTVDAVLTVYDPEQQSDHPAMGYVDPPTMEEYLQSIGHWMEPGELEMTDPAQFGDASFGEMFPDSGGEALGSGAPGGAEGAEGASYE